MELDWTTLAVRDAKTGTVLRRAGKSCRDFLGEIALWSPPDGAVFRGDLERHDDGHLTFRPYAYGSDRFEVVPA